MAHLLSDIYIDRTGMPSAIGRGACLRCSGKDGLFLLTGTLRGIELVQLPEARTRSSIAVFRSASLSQEDLQALLGPVSASLYHWTYLGQSADVLASLSGY